MPRASRVDSTTLRVDNPVMSLSYAPSGDILAVGDYGGNIHFFNAQGEKTLSPVNVGYAPFSLDDVGAIFNQICDFHKSD